MYGKEEKVAHINGKYLIVGAIIGLIGTVVTVAKDWNKSNTLKLNPVVEKPTESESKANNQEELNLQSRPANAQNQEILYKRVKAPEKMKDHGIKPQEKIDSNHPVLKDPPKEILPEKVNK